MLGMVEHVRHARTALFIHPTFSQQLQLPRAYLPPSVYHPVLQRLRIGPSKKTERFTALSHATGNTLLLVAVAQAHKWPAILRIVA